jgi:hypothetical protein
MVLNLTNALFGIEANYAGFFTPGLHPGMICGAPLGRGNSWYPRTQGCTLGWYAAPLWGAKTNRSSMSWGDSGLACVTPLGYENEWYSYPGGTGSDRVHHIVPRKRLVFLSRWAPEMI